jgi:hypothetical protein
LLAPQHSAAPPANRIRNKSAKLLAGKFWPSSKKPSLKFSEGFFYWHFQPSREILHEKQFEKKPTG